MAFLVFLLNGLVVLVNEVADLVLILEGGSVDGDYFRRVLIDVAEVCEAGSVIRIGEGRGTVILIYGVDLSFGELVGVEHPAQRDSERMGRHGV